MASAAPAGSPLPVPALLEAPTMTEAELSKFRKELKVGDLVDMQSAQHLSRAGIGLWFLGEVSVMDWDGISGANVHAHNHTKNDVEKMPLDSPRLWPPMIKTDHQSRLQAQAATYEKAQAALAAAPMVDPNALLHGMAAAKQQAAAHSPMEDVRSAAGANSVTLKVTFPKRDHHVIVRLLCNQPLKVLLEHQIMTGMNTKFAGFFVADAHKYWQQVDSEMTPEQLRLHDGDAIGIRLDNAQPPRPAVAQHAAAAAAGSPQVARGAAPASASPATAGASAGSPLPAAAAVANFGFTLQPGDLCDCLDTEQKWRVAEVISRAWTRLLVHYVDRSSKWDEWLQNGDPRIQPPRTRTEGYTGPRKRPLQEDGAAQASSNLQNSVAGRAPPAASSAACAATAASSALQAPVVGRAFSSALAAAAASSDPWGAAGGDGAGAAAAAAAQAATPRAAAVMPATPDIRPGRHEQDFRRGLRVGHRVAFLSVTHRSSDAGAVGGCWFQGEVIHIDPHPRSDDVLHVQNLQPELVPKGRGKAKSEIDKIKRMSDQLWPTDVGPAQKAAVRERVEQQRVEAQAATLRAKLQRIDAQIGGAVGEAAAGAHAHKKPRLDSAAAASSSAAAAASVAADSSAAAHALPAAAAASAPVSESDCCSVCLERPRDCALQCGHRLCMTCAAQVDKCPLCCVAITMRLKLF